MLSSTYTYTLQSLKYDNIIDFISFYFALLLSICGIGPQTENYSHSYRYSFGYYQDDLKDSLFQQQQQNFFKK